MPPGLTRERLGDILAVGTLAQGVPQEPAVHELRHFGIPPIRRDDGIFSTPYRALWKQSCISTSYGDDPFPMTRGTRSRCSGRDIERDRSRSANRFTYARADPADRIFKHVVTAGYMEESVAPLSPSLSLALSLSQLKPARAKRIISAVG